jgi:ATP-dependent Clp protease ATP-binding subunit ClpA
VKHGDEGTVIKYFDLIDEFIRVRCCTEELLTEFLNHEITNKASYRARVVESCVPDFHREVRNALARMDEDYDPEIVEELLYQLCIDVNPGLEIHQVSLPGKGMGLAAGQDSHEAPGSTTGTSALQRKARALEKALKAQVIGQDQAVEGLVRAVKKAAVGLKRPGRPIGTFLLVGRTGTGKTELAKALAQELFDGPGSLIRIDCSEYALPHEYAKLIGSPPGYIGHNEGGYLTESVRKKGACVVLFDEIEKAHSRMGFARKGGVSMEGSTLRDATIDALKEAFRPEFVNRIDDIVVFNPLDVKVCSQIAHGMLREIQDLLNHNGIRIEFSPGVRSHLAREGFSEEYGARELRRLIKRQIEDPLTDMILQESLGQGAVVRVRVRHGQPELELVRRASTEVAQSA